VYSINDNQIYIGSNKKLRSETEEHPQSPSVISTYEEKERPRYSKYVQEKNNKRTENAKLVTSEKTQ
jgi:hypothetical protein